MNALLSKIIKINELHIVGVNRWNDREIFYVLTVKKSRNQIDIVSSAKFETLEALLKNLDVKLPVIVAVDGKDILNKVVDFNSETDSNWYKNIDFSTIYHTAITEENLQFISFCRKNLVEEQLLCFKEKGLQVADVYIGSLLSALLYHSIQKDKMVSGNLILEFEDEKLKRFTRKSESDESQQYHIGKDVISSDFLPLYGILVQFFINAKTVSKTKNETLHTEEIIYRKAFNIFGAGMLGFFLLALLSSYVLIQYYGSKNAELSLRNVYHNESYQRVVELEEQKEKKLRIATESGVLSSKFLTFYAYEIIKSMPPDISLNGLDVIPLTEEAKSGRKMIFKTNTILVDGETFNESSFNHWLETLKSTLWISSFEIVKLKKDKKNKSQFEILITVKDV